MPTARLTAITLGVSHMRSGIAFYEALGFLRRMRATGEEVAFFDTGASTLMLWSWAKLAAEAGVADQPHPAAFRGTTLAWNCNSRAEVDAALAHPLACGARSLKPARPTDYGGYAGCFADPDGHVWEVVTAPALTVAADGRLAVPD